MATSPGGGTASANASPSQSLVVASPTPLASGMLKIFDNTDYGFLFSYPSDWDIDVHGLDSTTKMDYMAVSNFPARPSPGFTVGANAFRVEMYVQPNADHLGLADWVAEFRNMPGEPADTVEETESVTVAEHEGIRQLVVEGEGPVASAIYEDFFGLPTGVLIVTGPPPDSPWLAAYNQIVRSLVFR